MNEPLTHDHSAEKAALAVALQHPDAARNMLERLTPEHFHAGCRIIFDAMAALDSEGVAIDLLTVAGKLRELKQDAYVPLLGSLIDVVPSTRAMPEYIRRIEDSSRREQLRTIGESLVASANDVSQSPEDSINEVYTRLLNLDSDSTAGAPAPTRTLVPTVIERLTRLREGNRSTGLRTGFSALDSLLSGMRAGELIYLAGRPGTGKTALGLNIATHCALDGASVAIFSLEMSSDSLVQRLLASTTGIDGRVFRTGLFTPHQWQLVYQVGEDMQRWKMSIDDSALLTPPNLLRRARLLQKSCGLDFIVVDYVQLMSIRPTPRSRYDEVSMISRALKDLAKRLSVPVLALSQLARRAEDREGGVPQLSDLRESGQLEQDADAVLLLSRNMGPYSSEEDKLAKQREATLNVAKNRSGPTGSVALVFDSAHTLFSEPAVF